MDEDAGELWPSIDVSRYCFEDEVVEDEGVAALELLNPNFFNFDFCFDAIATLGQSVNGTPKKKNFEFNQEQAQISVLPNIIIF